MIGVYNWCTIIPPASIRPIFRRSSSKRYYSTVIVVTSETGEQQTCRWKFKLETCPVATRALPTNSSCTIPDVAWLKIACSSSLFLLYLAWYAYENLNFGRQKVRQICLPTVENFRQAETAHEFADPSVISNLVAPGSFGVPIRYSRTFSPFFSTAAPSRVVKGIGNIIFTIRFISIVSLLFRCRSLSNFSTLFGQQ